MHPPHPVARADWLPLELLRIHYRPRLGLVSVGVKDRSHLVQELGREINTIGSKANDGQITRRVIAFKTELERIREQVQNIE